MADPNLDPVALAQQNRLLDALKQHMFGSLLGSGMAQNAAQALNGLPYQRHVQEAQALGQTPMTPQQFMQQQNPGQ